MSDTLRKIDDMESSHTRDVIKQSHASLSKLESKRSSGYLRPPEKNTQDYRSIDNVQLGELSQPANEQYAQSSLGRFRFRHEPDLPRSHPAVDLILTILCFAVVHFSYLGNLEFSTQRSIGLFSAIVLISTSLYVGGIYNTRRLRRLNTELTHLAICWAFAFAAIGLFAFLSKTAGDISRVWITTSMAMVLISLVSIRILGSLGFMAVKKASTRKIVILGNSTNIKSVIHDLGKLTDSHIEVARIFDLGEHHSQNKAYLQALKISAKQLSIYVENQRQSGAAVEQVWIAVSSNQSQLVNEATAALVNSSVDVCVIPDLFAQRLMKGELSRYGNTEIINVSEISLSLTADQFKRVFDLAVASLSLLVLGIPMLLIAAVIKLESKGPALFRQKRYGVDGQEIEILKFRSMVVHTDHEVQQAVKNDTRVTRFGKFIRQTSLDELPQLLNVLNGTMSLVGPRPHAVSHNEVWRRQIHGYMFRHKVRPGITGWAQVNGWRGETDTAFKMQQRVKYDLEYIRNWSPWLDLKILVLTVFVGFVHKNAY